MNIGLERELLLEGSRSDEIMQLGLPEVHREFFDCMVELVTGVHHSSAFAVRELCSVEKALLAHGFRFHPFASWAYHEPPGMTSFARVTSDTEYYKWVYYVAAPDPFDIHHVGIHINLSDDRFDEDDMVRATNLLRTFGFLFILLTGNSPLRRHKPSGYISRRSFFFPSRYDVPLWENAGSFLQWVMDEEAARRIYPGKARAWMTACPRLRNNDVTQPIERIEFRAIDSGSNLSHSVIEGVCELAIRIVQQAIDSHDHFPVSFGQIQDNDKSVARCGSTAQVLFRDQFVPVLDVARDWCSGIAKLEEALACGSPGEQLLRGWRCR